MTLRVYGYEAVRLGAAVGLPVWRENPAPAPPVMIPLDEAERAISNKGAVHAGRYYLDVTDRHVALLLDRIDNHVEAYDALERGQERDDSRAQFVREHAARFVVSILERFGHGAAAEHVQGCVQLADSIYDEVRRINAT